MSNITLPAIELSRLISSYEYKIIELENEIKKLKDQYEIDLDDLYKEYQEGNTVYLKDSKVK